MSKRKDTDNSSNIRVLLVDDSKAFRHVAANFVERQRELTVVGAVGRGEEMLARAHDLEPQVILVGLERTGLDAIRRLRKALPRVGIIALTLQDGDTYRQAAEDAGADDLVQKAKLTTDLLLAVGRVMQAGRFG